MTKDIPQQIAKANENACLFHEEERFEAAANAAVHACELARQHLGPQSLELASILDNLATAYESLGWYEEARSHYHNAIEIYRSRNDTNPLELASTLNNLGLLCCSIGDIVAAEQLSQETRQICIMSGERDLFYAVVLHNMGLLYQSIRDYPSAQVLVGESLILRCIPPVSVRATQEAQRTNHQSGERGVDQVSLSR